MIQDLCTLVDQEKHEDVNDVFKQAENGNALGYVFEKYQDFVVPGISKSLRFKDFLMKIIHLKKG